MVIKWSRWPALVIVGVVSVVSAQCTQSTPSAPSSVAAGGSLASTNAVGDITSDTPAAGVAKVCKSGNVPGTFTVAVVSGSPSVLSPITVNAGQCRIAAETAAGTTAQVSITETSAGLQSVTLATCRNAATGGACSTIEHPAFSNGGTVDLQAGSDNVKGATASFVNNVAPPPNVALFVIGDVEPHAVGDNVNFWGAQWWKNNQMSGFVANGVASFKGYATDSTNQCGGTWVSNPGNSSDPPATIPAVVRIIVTDTVVKDGNNISGTIKQIVNVQHDGNYGPAPGHDGNGPVVSVVCTQ